VAIGERRRPDPGGRPGYLRVDTVHQGDTEHARGVYTGRTSEGEAKQVAKGRIKLTQDSSSFEPPCEQATCHLFSASYEHSAHPIHLEELEIQAAAMQRQLAAMVSDHLLLFRA
jgi:hypothetical protein